jgi:hypothetical protein
MSVPDRLSEFLGSPSTQPPLSSSSSTNPSQSSSQSSSSSPSISIREDQIENAIAFLQHASVANSPLEQRYTTIFQFNIQGFMFDSSSLTINFLFFF